MKLYCTFAANLSNLIMRIGIYGGSFNPIHEGHTALAASLVSQQLVDELWLMVSPLNPLKEADRSEYASYDDRLQMARLATEDIPNVRVSDFERSLPLPSYTITTLHALEKAYMQHQFVLIIGADNWQRFDHWYRADEIRQHYPILVYRRPGYDVDNTETDNSQNNIAVTESSVNVQIVDTPLYDISSTQLRTALRAGKDTGQWLAPKVADYINQKGLYKNL